VNKDASPDHQKLNSLYSALPYSSLAPVILGASTLLGCARGHLDDTRRDQTFRTIQVHEASISRAQAELTLRDDCERGQATEQVCDAAQALCAASSALSDRDATARCVRAGDTCSAAREHRRARCARHGP